MRPDFRARVSAAELSATGIAALSASGHVVRLEVKARTGWASYRRKGGDGLELLHDLSNKAASKANCVFLSVIVSLPGKDQKRAKRARIILADPGDPTALERDDQIVLLLEESLHQLVRHGLWPTLSSALDWLRLLRGKLTEEKNLYFGIRKVTATSFSMTSYPNSAVVGSSMAAYSVMLFFALDIPANAI